MLNVDQYSYIRTAHLLAERHKRKPVIITIDTGFGDWTQIFGDPRDERSATRSYNA